MEDNKLFAEFPPVSTEKWEEVINKDLKGADYEKKLVWKTIEGFKVKPYYRAEDLQGLEYLEANPDQYPYTRGTNPRGNVWDIRQDIREDDPSKANALAVEAAKRGATSLGFRGCKVSDEASMETLLKGLRLDEVKVNFLCSKDWLATLQLLEAAATKMGYDPAQVAGSLNYDPFRHAMRHAAWQRGEQQEADYAAALVGHAEQHTPKMRVLTVNGNIFRNAGGNITQELGYALAAANDWMACLTDKGLAPSQVARQLTLSLAADGNYFMEIAKLRAARLLWSKIAKAYDPDHEATCKIFIHSASATWNKSIYDPYVNMLRTTTETMSAVVGGADSITTEPFDSAYEQPTDFSLRIARNQQILLKEESYMEKIVDPSAGSYYIENLTDSIAQHAWARFLEVEQRGGFRQAVDKGLVQDEVEKTAQATEKQLAERRMHILGTNIFPNLKERATNHAIAAPRCCASQEGGTLKTLQPRRGAQPYEELRMATEKSARRPKVFLLTYGDLTMRKARSGFATSFLGVAGYDIIDNNGFDTPQHGVDAALEAQADIVVLCSSDDEYPALAQAAAPLLKGKVKSIVLAGAPGEREAEYRALGVDEFIHLRTNVVESLRRFQKLLGIM